MTLNGVLALILRFFTEFDCGFSSKIALRLKKVCYKVSFCENCQRQSCKAFIGLTIRAKKMIVGGRPLKRKFCIGLDWTRSSSLLKVDDLH